MCCKIMGVGEIAKPARQWCPQCEIGVGCRIYETRPGECRRFDCVWLLDTVLGPEWRPDRAHFVMAYEIEGKRLAVRVDGQRPEAWKRAPYYDWLKRFAARGAPSGQYVMVDQAGRAIIVLPNRDVDLGIVAPDERILTRTWGNNPDAVKLKDGSPRPPGF